MPFAIVSFPQRCMCIIFILSLCAGGDADSWSPHQSLGGPLWLARQGGHSGSPRPACQEGEGKGHHRVYSVDRA